MCQMLECGDLQHVQAVEDVEENRVENHVEERKVQRKREEDVKKGAEEDANKCRRHITMGLAPSCSG